MYFCPFWYFIVFNNVLLLKCQRKDGWLIILMFDSLFGNVFLSKKTALRYKLNTFVYKCTKKAVTQKLYYVPKG